jgi:peroxiredoxin
MKKKTSLTIVIIVLTVIGLLFVFGQQGGRKGTLIREGDQAPEFRLSTLEGRSVSLSSFKGKVVIVHFWATWCPPCVDEIPTLDRLFRAMAGRDLEILAVSVDEGGAEAVGGFMQRNRLSLPVLLNPDRSVANLYGTLKFPETYLVDREGIVRRKIIGAADWTRPDAIGLITELLKKSQITGNRKQITESR